MATTVTYSLSLNYMHEARTGRRFPGLDVTIHGPVGSDRTIAHIDTGAEYCFFNGMRASALGIDLLSGERKTLTSAAGGSTEAYLHEVELEFLSLSKRVRTVVAFSSSSIQREILGRNGFLDNIQLGVREKRQMLYVEPFS